MRSFLFLGVLWFLAAHSTAWAQLDVAVQTKRTEFLLYERLDLLVTLTNNGDTDLILDNNEGRPWLSFLVTKENHLPVPPERKSTFQSLTLKAGESKTLSVNITPLFSFREEGNYRTAAVVDLPGHGEIVSSNAPFTILRGLKVWTQQREIDGASRTYSLVRFSPKIDTTKLYLRVEDPDANIVYTNIALGDIVSSMNPQEFFDPKGNIHILNPVALSTYLYTRADATGKILDQRIFRTSNQIPPRLAKLNDGNVFVAGGVEDTPQTQRARLSDTQGARKPAPLPGDAAPSASTDFPNPNSTPSSTSADSPAPLPADPPAPLPTDSASR